MTVRTAVPADAPALADVAEATFRLACPPDATEAAMAEHIAAVLSVPAFESWLGDPDRVLLVDDPGDGAPFAGYAMVVLAEPADPDVAGSVRIRPTSELSKIYVREGQHGRGTAGELMSRSLDEARARGAAGMWLGTHEENRRAQRFYVKHGFARVGSKRFRLGDRLERDHVYERAL